MRRHGEPFQRGYLREDRHIGDVRTRVEIQLLQRQTSERREIADLRCTRTQAFERHSAERCKIVNWVFADPQEAQAKIPNRREIHHLASEKIQAAKRRALEKRKIAQRLPIDGKIIGPIGQLQERESVSGLADRRHESLLPIPIPPEELLRSGRCIPHLVHDLRPDLPQGGMIAQRGDGCVFLGRQSAILRRKEEEFERLDVREHRVIARRYAAPEGEFLQWLPTQDRQVNDPIALKVTLF